VVQIFLFALSWFFDFSALFPSLVNKTLRKFEQLSESGSGRWSWRLIIYGEWKRLKLWVERKVVASRDRSRDKSSTYGSLPDWTRLDTGPQNVVEAHYRSMTINFHWSRLNQFGRSRPTIVAVDGSLFVAIDLRLNGSAHQSGLEHRVSLDSIRRFAKLFENKQACRSISRYKDWANHKQKPSPRAFPWIGIPRSTNMSWECE